MGAIVLLIFYIHFLHFSCNKDQFFFVDLVSSKYLKTFLTIFIKFREKINHSKNLKSKISILKKFSEIYNFTIYLFTIYKFNFFKLFYNFLKFLREINNSK